MSRYDELEQHELAKFCLMLSQPVRLSILLELRKSPKMVCSGLVAERIQTRPSVVSHHLQIMEKSRVVTSVRNGNRIYYQVNELVWKQMSERIKLLGKGKGE